MRIGLRLFYNPGWMGGVNYVLNLARALQTLPRAERPHVTFLTAAPAAEALAAANRDLCDAVCTFAEGEAQRLDFVYPATQFAEAPFGVPWAGWIPDWQCRYMPEFFAPGERARRFIQYRLLAQEAPVCVLSSEMALQDTERLFPDAHAPLRVMHFPAVYADEIYRRAAADIAATAERLGAPKRYLLIANQFWKHKNHLVALQALRAARHSDAHIVMSGAVEDARWPDYAATVRALLADPVVAPRATLLGSIRREDQIDLMLGCQAILQPSRFEGWSTVVEEARALGLPSLLSDFPVHREQNPAHARFFNPDDVDQLAAMIDDCFASPPPHAPLLAAQQLQSHYVQSCARVFLSIAKQARAAYDPARHDPKAIAARTAIALRAETAAADTAAEASGVQAITAEDEALFLANVRASFREHPIELARFAAMFCAPVAPDGTRLFNHLVAPALAKMPSDLRALFEAEQARLVEAGGAQAGARFRGASGRIFLIARILLERLRDAVSSRLTRRFKR